MRDVARVCATPRVVEAAGIEPANPTRRQPARNSALRAAPSAAAAEAPAIPPGTFPLAAFAAWSLVGAGCWFVILSTVGAI